MTKQFGFKQVLGHRRTVDRREWLVVSRTRVVNSPGEQFLTCTAFAGDQNARIGCRNHLRLLQNLFHALVARNNFRCPVFLDIGRARDAQRFIDRDHQLVFVDRFRQETECAALRGNNSIRDCAVSGDNDNA